MAKNFYRYFNYHYWLRKFYFSLIFQKYFFISKSKKRKIVFSSIYKSFHWRDYKKTEENESVSGLGSDLDVCEKIIKGRKVKVPGYKKAIITLKKGQSIDLTTGI